MAYVPTNQDDEEERRTSAGAPPGTFGDTTPTSSATKTDFVNVSDYLNKNPEASQHLGDLASSKLDAQRADTQSAVDSAKSGFGQQVQSGSTNLDQGLLDSAFAAPDTFVKDSNNLSRFLGMRDASYKGPNSLQQTDVFAPAQAKVTALQQAGQGIGTEAGRTKLVSDLSTNPNHGKAALNQLLLQGNSAAAQKIQSTADSFGGVADQWNQFVQESPNQVSAAQTATNQAREATRAGLTDATDKFGKELDSQLATKTNERNAFNLNYQNINKAISDGGAGLSQQQLTDLGIADAYPYISKLQEFNGPTALGYYGSPVQLSNYATNPGSANTNMPTRESVASTEQYAREAALQQMAGMDLGLPDQQANPYVANGQLPSLDYMGAFNKAGTDLKNFDQTWQPKVAGYGVEDINQLYAIKGRNNPDLNGSFYNDPSVGAAPTGGYGIAPPPAGWDASQPVPYPQPTSNPPSNLINPQWNPYKGSWEGAHLQPGVPLPPPTGGYHPIR